MVTFLGSDALTEATIVLFSLFLFLLVSKCLNHVFVLVREVKFFLLDHAGLKGGRGRGQRALVASHVVCTRVSSSRVVLLSPFSLSLTRVAMAEVVHRNLESMLPQLEELESSGIFTHDEIK